jgi:hypothetical protein
VSGGGGTWDNRIYSINQVEIENNRTPCAKSRCARWLRRWSVSGNFMPEKAFEFGVVRTHPGVQHRIDSQGRDRVIDGEAPFLMIDCTVLACRPAFNEMPFIVRPGVSSISFRK